MKKVRIIFFLNDFSCIFNPTNLFFSGILKILIMFKHNASKASKASKGTKKKFQKRGGGFCIFKGKIQLHLGHFLL